MAKRTKTRQKVRVRKAARLPSGKYAWRGRAVPFGKLPKKEQNRFRSLWAKKAQKTAARGRVLKRKQAKAAKEGIVVTFRGRQKLRNGEVIPAAFIADKLPGQTVKDVVEAIREAARLQVSDDAEGSWIAAVDWPDDDRSEPSEPYQTIASLPVQELDDDTLGKAESYFDEIEEDGTLLLDRQKSGARGTADIKTIEWAVFYGL